MLRNYLVVTLRNLFGVRTGRPARFAVINLAGLAIGLAAVFLITAYVAYVLSYDAFFPNADGLVRVAVRKTEAGETTFHSAKTYPGIGDLLVRETAEVTGYVRILDEECMFHEKETDRKFNRQRTFWADGGFPEVFGLTFVEEGDVRLLYEPNHAVVSRSAAERFFGTDWRGDRSPVGKTVYLNEHIPFTIQGVFEDLPPNSHMKVDFVVSYETLVVLVGPDIGSAMPPGWNVNYTYLTLAPGADAARVEPLVNEVLQRRIPAERLDGARLHFALQPVQDIYLTSHLIDELNPNGNRWFVVALVLAAALILVVAWINFINLTTVRSLDRAREVGVRKALGAERRQLAAQFVLETMVAGLTAAMLAVGLVAASYGAFQRVAGIDVALFSAANLPVWALFAALVVGGGLAAGVYPALVLSSFEPVRVLKGKSGGVPGGVWFRQSLIVFQFVAAIVLLCCTGAVYYQVDYMRGQDLGMNPDQVFVMHSPRSMIGNSQRASVFESFRERILRHPQIVSVGSSGAIPGKEFLYHREGIHAAGSEQGRHVSFDVASVDDGYLPTLEVTFLAGRNFERGEADEHRVIANEAAIRALGFAVPADAIDAVIVMGDVHRRIAGVVEDVHYEGLQKEIRPLLLTYGHDYEFGFFEAKLAGGDVRAAVEAIEAAWERTYPNDPFDYFFLDAFFDAQYEHDRRFGAIFGLFSLLAIFVAMLGLFGLVSFTTYQRSREIGIRKVMGAGVADIVGLVTRRFFALILVASVVALPLAYLAVRAWLDTFAYRVEAAWWWYAVPVLVIHAVALLAVGRQSLSAALANPVDAIREE